MLLWERGQKAVAWRGMVEARKAETRRRRIREKQLINSVLALS